ncbi:MAG: Na+:solute symporter [Planctomycetes bacterium]|nr:Na+:solute symporter [Planctomycetota bacterium]
MQVHWIDWTIIGIYLVSTILIGFLISKRASKDMESYFLGGKTFPWYILGVSNASGMFDITGTMWLVYLVFVYGLKGVLIPWAWPVFNQIFLMVFLSTWLRRSNVMTGAEWIKTRFGTGTGAQLSHLIIVIFALVSVIGFLAYGFKGIGKFSSQFLPWGLTPNQYGLIFMGITTLYVVKGGMYSVVLTELIQFGIMTIASISIGIIAMNKVSALQLTDAVPDGWNQLFFGWHLNLDWTGILDSVNTKIANDGYGFFGCFIMMLVFKGFLVSFAGPAPNYDMQRILATKSPKEAAKMSGAVSVALFFPRYMLIAGLAVLAIVYLMPDLGAMGEDIDFEMILPLAIGKFVPVGLLGILMAGLIAAFMSTFAATVNAAPAYIVNDIYKRYINPHASDRKYVYMSYITSLAVVIVGISFGFFVESINTITLWIVMNLWGGYTAANLLKWYWWRFNGFGYFWGMMAGLISSLTMPKLIPLAAAKIAPGLLTVSDVFYVFPIILILSLLGSILGTLLTKPDDEEVLKSFYKKVRPWGFWGPIRDKVLLEDPDFMPNKDFKRDMFNIVVGIIWQSSMVVIPIYLIIEYKVPLYSAIAILVITSLILKKNWYDKLVD